jgi:hypothetical protein
MARTAAAAVVFGLLVASPVPAQQKQAAPTANRIELGRLAGGAAVAFVRAGGEWGIDISGAGMTRIAQPKPAQIEVYRGGDNVGQLASGYQSLRKEAGAIVAQAKLAGATGAAFAVEDRWTVSGAALSLSRKVTVTRAEADAGFYSAIRLATDPKIAWSDVDCMAPGLLYGDPAYDGANSPGGTAYYKAKRFSIREDNFSAPLFALSFRDGRWAAVMDMAPRGDTTQAETTATAATPIIDERIQFGGLGARELPEGGIEYGFWLPGTTNEFSGGRGAPAAPVVRRRYHPVKLGFSHSYQAGFRFGQNASFRGMQREAWRWAWDTLKPKVKPIDLDVARRAMLDHLLEQVLIVDGRAGVPFLYDAVSGRPGSYRWRGRPGGQPPAAAAPGAAAQAPMGGRGGLSGEAAKELAAWAKQQGVELDPAANELELWPKVIMGFVSKGIEVADQLLREGDRDTSARGKKMREDGLLIIDSFVRLVPMSPPAGTGFNLRTGQPDTQSPGVVTVREPSEDMRTLMDAYRREKRLGRDHPEWLRWCRSFADWLLTQQRDDGSWPRSWVAGKGEPRETSSTATYNPVALMVRMTEETGDKKYLASAVRAADFVWASFGSKGVFIGGATDNPNIVDKEAGMLSMEAFLALYENTKEPKWLERAKAAGDYAESWIWIWNVPMPIGRNEAEIHWKTGASTIGTQGITAQAFATVDTYASWSVPAYARLYKYTNDAHYLDVARVLLHGSMAMLALPGRTYDFLGTGWEQEHWKMGPNTRGYGGHRAWLPWMSTNHLHGITGVEEFDKAIYEKLAKGN